MITKSMFLIQHYLEIFEKFRIGKDWNYRANVIG